MSRQQATKSRGEKGAGRGGGGAQSVSIPAVSNDVLPGRMTVADWNKISAVDDDDDFVSQIVEEILDVTLDKCFDKYIWKQVLPYTVFSAKEDLLQIIEWRFLSHDIGEIDVKINQGWAEDAEPEPGVIDSWAQGSVPIIITKSPDPPMPPVMEEIIIEKLDEEQQLIEEIVKETISIGTGFITHDIGKETGPPAEGKELQKPEEKPSKKKIKYRKHVGRLPSAHVGRMEMTLEHSESELFARELSDLNLPKDPGAHLSPSQKSLLKLQAGRPPGNKEVTFDEKGNIVAVMRLDTKSLPSHKVRVNYSIIDPAAEAAAQRLEAMRTGNIRWRFSNNPRGKPSFKPRHQPEFEPPQEQKPMLPIPPSPRKKMHPIYTAKSRATAQTIQRSHIHSKHLHLPASRRRGNENPNVEPLPPSLIESIDASPGVVITEGDQVKAGSTPRQLGPLRQAPVIREDGTIIGNVMMSAMGGRTLRLLGAAPASSSGKSDSTMVMRPILSPSRVITSNTPYVTSPFSVSQPVPPLRSNSITSS